MEPGKRLLAARPRPTWHQSISAAVSPLGVGQNDAVLRIWLAP